MPIEKFDETRYVKESAEQEVLLGVDAAANGNYREADSFFFRAHRRGNVLAGVLRGDIYYSGHGKECEVDTDDIADAYSPEKAIPLFAAAGEQGCPLGTALLADAYRTGRGVPKDKDRARKLYADCVLALKAMCEAGSADACYLYGYNMLSGFYTRRRVSDEELKESFSWLEKAMRGGHIRAGIQVARAYLNGWGVEKDETKGMELLKRYADVKESTAQMALGAACYFGKGRKQDLEQAFRHFLAAAEMEDAYAQFVVGKLYLEDAKYQKAEEWFQKSASQGNARALLFLAKIYMEGTSLGADSHMADSYRAERYLIEAEKRLSEAAEEGELNAGDYRMLSEIYTRFYGDNPKYQFTYRKGEYII